MAACGQGRRAGRLGTAGRAALLVVLAVALGLFLTSCRDSDVITEIIAGEIDEYEVDDSLDPVQIENPETASSQSQEQDESERENDYEEEDPDYDEDDADSEQDSTAASSEGTGDSDSISGEASDGDTSSYVSDGTGGESSYPSITFDFTGNSDILGGSDEDAEDEGDTSTSEDNPWVTSNDSTISTSPGLVTVATPSGGYSNLPEAGSVAAAGQIAALVQSIGGEGSLAVCNTEWYESLPSSAYGNLSELSGVTCVDGWGDGSSMASCYEEIAEALPHDGSGVVLVDESTYESEYDDYFNDLDISVVVLEAYGTNQTADSWIDDDVAIVAALLAGMDDGGAYAKAQANAWTSLHDSALSETLSLNKGYSIFTQESAGDAIVYDYLYTLSGNYEGSSTGENRITYISPNSYAFFYVYDMPATDTSTVAFEDDMILYFSQSVSNWGGQPNTPLLRHIKYSHYIWPMDTWDGDISEWTGDDCFKVDISDGLPLLQPESDQSDWVDANKYYTTDYYLQHAGAVSPSLLHIAGWYEGGRVGDFLYSSAYGVDAYDYGDTMVWCSFTRIDKSADVGAAATVAGDEDAPYVVARTAEVADSIVASAGTADESTYTFGICDTGQDYTVAVMPWGVSGCWDEGTFESFLMAPYFYCLYQEVSGGTVDLSYCDEYVNEFYQTFYRCGASVLENTSSSKSYGWYGYWVAATANLG